MYEPIKFVKFEPELKAFRSQNSVFERQLDACASEFDILSEALKSFQDLEAFWRQESASKVHLP